MSSLTLSPQEAAARATAANSQLASASFDPDNAAALLNGMSQAQRDAYYATLTPDQKSEVLASKVLLKAALPTSSAPSAINPGADANTNTPVVPNAASFTPGSGATEGNPLGYGQGGPTGNDPTQLPYDAKTNPAGYGPNGPPPISQDASGNTIPGGTNGLGQGSAPSTPPPTTPSAPPKANLPPNVPGTASRSGTQAAAPTPITAPSNGFKAGVVGGTVATQPGITTQQVTAPSAVAGQAAQTPAVTATTLNAPQNTFKAGVTAGTVAAPAAITAQTVTAPQNTFKAGVTAGTVAAPATITPQQLTSSITPDQQAAIDLAKAQATGTAPSAAQALLQKGIDQDIGASYGLAASIGGRNAGQALLQGSANAQNSIAKSAADMAALRATEIQQGTQEYGTLSQGAAGQELTRNTSNQTSDLTAQINNVQNTISVLTNNRDAALKAGLQNQADQLTAQLENQKETLSALQGNQTSNLTAQINNVQNTIAVLTSNRDAALKAGLQNQADQLTAQIENQKETLSALQSNQSSLLAAATSTAANATAVNTSNAALRTQASQTNTTAGEAASAANAINNLNAQIQTAQNNITVLTSDRDAALKAGLQNQADQLTAQINDANNQLDAAKANLTAQTSVSQSNATNATTLSQADLNAFEDAMKLNDSDRQLIATQGLTAWADTLDDATKNRAITVAANTANNAATMSLIGSFFGDVAKGVGAFASDKRLKAKISSGDREARSFLDSLTSKTWDYKDSARDGAGRHLGPMAQDVARSKAGRTFVVKLVGRGGALGLDPVKAVGPILSGLASLHQRLAKVEGKR